MKSTNIGPRPSVDTARLVDSDPAASTQPARGGSARQPSRLQHDALVARAQSQPLSVGRQGPRNAQLSSTSPPGSPESVGDSLHVSPNLSPSVSVLGDVERSDRFVHERAGRPGARQPAPEPPPARSWKATVTAMLGTLANGAATASGTVANRAGTAWNGVAGAVTQAAGALTHAAGEARTAVTNGANAAWHGVADAATYTGGLVVGEVRGQAEAFGVAIPSGRMMGAVAGHVIHQSVTVGVPTFVREMLSEALVLSLRNMPPDHVLALQVAVGAMSTGVQFYRRALENRNPDAAARGFHALSQAQWDAHSDSTKADLRRQQVAHSRLVTNLQMASSATSLMVGIMAARSGDPSQAETPARVLAIDLKAAVYASMRDTLQASFSMVGTAAPTTGVSGTHMNSSAAFFSFMAAGTDYGFSYLPANVPGAALASEVLRGTQPQGTQMTHGEAWQARAGVAAVKAAINTTLHASDWIYMTQEEANQAGTVQRWDPKLKLLRPESHDYSRIKDHVPTRVALLGGGNSLSNVISFAMRNSPEHLRTAVGNFADATYQGVIYKTIVGTWQAQAEVQANPRPATDVSVAVDLEAGHAQELQTLPSSTLTRSRSI